MPAKRWRGRWQATCGAAPLFVPCDLLDIDALRAAMAQVHAALGDAAVLVNNAANDQRHVLSEVTPEEFDLTIGVNFRHVFFAAQAVVPQMQARGGGSIINMSSIAWLRGMPALPVYAGAKAAIVGFTNSLARLVGPDRIRVNAIAPGMVITERQRRLWFQDEQKIAEGRARQAIPDAVTPDDIANMALFLASDDSQRITRQCFLSTAALGSIGFTASIDDRFARQENRHGRHPSCFAEEPTRHDENLVIHRHNLSFRAASASILSRCCLSERRCRPSSRGQPAPRNVDQQVNQHEGQ